MEHGAGLTKLPMIIDWGKPSVVTAFDTHPDVSNERHGALKRVAYPAVCICIDCALVYLLLDKP